MIKITGAGEAPPTTRAKKTSKASAAFTPGATQGTESTSSAQANSVSAPETLAALIALQTDDAPSRKTHAAAQRILDQLDELRMRILNGALAADDLEGLAAAATMRAHAGAPDGLLAIYDEIRLRAQVELAKLGR